MDSLVLFVLLLVSFVRCRTLYYELNAPTNEELSFMKRYGYLPAEQGGVDFAYTPHSVAEAIRKVQAFAGLPQTGALDPETRKLFKRKRCGMKDIEDKPTRRRRYLVQQGWNKRDISYRVLNGSSTLDKSRIEELMAEGLAIWAPHGGLYFYRLDEGKADIQLSFSKGDHGDGFPFDGPGRVVAHAFPPPLGDMHFDDDELWGSDADPDDEDVTDFFAAAVHEIGHALGLSHSSVKASVMYPYYRVPVENLHMDDILGMRELYFNSQQETPESAEIPPAPTIPQFTVPERENDIEEVTEWPVIAATPTVPRFTKPDVEEEEEIDDEDENSIPDLCFTNYDAIQVIQGKIFVFEEEWVWVMRDRKEIEPGFPRRFHSLFEGLPDHVTAIRTVYEMRNGHIRVFHGRRYWEFDESFRIVKKGNIREYGLPSQVPELSTVFVSNYNNKTYLIEYERFWRYDEDRGSMDEGYPKDMSAWRQVPYPVGSGLIWQGDTYFFVGPRFWRFDNSLVRAHEHYPLPTARVWFPCARALDMDRYVVNERP